MYTVAVKRENQRVNASNAVQADSTDFMFKNASKSESRLEAMIIWDWQCMELVEINRCQSIVFSVAQ
jgi:hypothetical protein